MTQHATTLQKDVNNNRIQVRRKFNAPLPDVWKAWTDSSLLDQWWAPKPWRAETKSMDFREGGRWLYCMVGPDGARHWSFSEYKTIVPQKRFVATDAFCDEDGNLNPAFASMLWTVEFVPAGDATEVQVEMKFARKEDMQQILEMGFEEGFTAAHGNLDELLAGKMAVQ
jgi:uncharacterized protein YndB with AHSA1/START domain